MFQESINSLERIYLSDSQEKRELLSEMTGMNEVRFHSTSFSWFKKFVKRLELFLKYLETWFFSFIIFTASVVWTKRITKREGTHSSTAMPADHKLVKSAVASLSWTCVWCSGVFCIIVITIKKCFFVCENCKTCTVCAGSSRTTAFPNGGDHNFLAWIEYFSIELQI